MLDGCEPIDCLEKNVIDILRENKRKQVGVTDACGCMWVYLTQLWIYGRIKHDHYNLFYSDDKHPRPLFPPATSLAPTLWPQFHLHQGCWFIPQY